MKKPTFLNSHIYHVYNRGVEKRDIFLDDRDRFQFVHDLFEFNDQNAVQDIKAKSRQPREELREVQPPQSREVEPPEVGVKRYENKNEREKIVDILAFVLMNNHFHLLLRQKIDDGVPRFMQKLGTGYTMSFNKKYERVGCLFQGRYKAVLIEREEHLRYLPVYIHMNPIKIKSKISGGTSGGSTSRSWEFLKNYRWSSLLDYIGKKNFLSVISKDFLSNGVLGSEKEHKREIQNWLKKSNEIGNIIDEIN